MRRLHRNLAFIRAIYRQKKGKKFRVLRTIKTTVKQVMSYPSYQKVFRSNRNAQDCLNAKFRERMDVQAEKPVMTFAYDPVAFIMQGGSRMRIDNVAVQGAENGVRYMLPFLDYRVIDFAVSIPRAQHQSGYGNRWIYLKTFEDILPESLLKVHNKTTVSLLHQSEEEKRKQREALLNAIKEVLAHLDRDYWKNYLNFEYLENFTLGEDSTDDEEDMASEIVEKLFYCSMIQNVMLEPKILQNMSKRGSI